MNRYSRLCQVLLLSLSLFQLSSCGKVGPCEGVRPLAASFRITEVPLTPRYRNKEPYDTDSVCTSEVRFIADEAGATEYNWTVGTDPRTFQGKELQLGFQNAAEKGLDVTLCVVKQSPCYGADTVKSSTRRFYLRPSQLSGTYEGLFSHSPIRTRLKIEADYIHPYYYTWQPTGTAPNFRGTLLTGIPVYDTLFIGMLGRELLNQRIYVGDYTDNDVINKTLRFPEGEIIYDPKQNVLTIALRATENKSNTVKTVSFTGKKIR